MKNKKAVLRDPVCGMQVDPQHAAASRQHMGQTFYFCSKGCAETFDTDPHRYAHAEASAH